MIAAKELVKALLPRPLHRGLLGLAYRVLRTARRMGLRETRGCAMIIYDDAGRILLVRHSYVEPDTWMLPAGKMGGSEDPLHAAAREIREEVKIDGLDLAMVEFEDTQYWGIDFQTYIVGAYAGVAPTPDNREIIAAEFFHPDALPENASLPTIERIKRWKFRRSQPIIVPAFVRPDYVARRFARRGRFPDA